jgi:uncharacterized membrane protein (DUF2068 family)
MNLARRIHKAFAFPNSDGLLIAECREDRAPQHEAQANRWMMMSAAIGTGGILDQVQPRLPSGKALHWGRTEKSSSDARGRAFCFSGHSRPFFETNWIDAAPRQWIQGRNAQPRSRPTGSYLSALLQGIQPPSLVIKDGFQDASISNPRSRPSSSVRPRQTWFGYARTSQKPCPRKSGSHPAQINPPGEAIASSNLGNVEYSASDRDRSAKTSVGLRTVAAFEAVKGAIVLLLGCGALHLMGKNLDDIGERIAEVLHVNPEGKLSNLFVELASHTTDRTLWVLALGALVYAAVRWIEAYGLWQGREWAQWFELLSTALYLAPEVEWLLRHPSWLKWSILITNLVILVYMLSLRVRFAATKTASHR